MSTSSNPKTLGNVGYDGYRNQLKEVGSKAVPWDVLLPWEKIAWEQAAAAILENLEESGWGVIPDPNAKDNAHVGA